MPYSGGYPVKKATEFLLVFPIYNNVGDLVSGATALDSEVSKDGAGFNDCNNEAVEIGTSGIYQLIITSAEMNATVVAIITKTTTVDAKTTATVIYTGYPVHKGTAFTLVFPIYDADGDLVTAAANLDSEISKDAAGFNDCTNEASEIGTSGIYKLTITATEMDVDIVALITKTTSGGAKTTPTTIYTAAEAATSVYGELQDAIYNRYLVTSLAAAITALYNTEAPGEAVMPYGTFSLVSNVPDWTFTEDFEDCLIQFTLFSETSTNTEINTAFAALKSAFDKYELIIVGQEIISLERGIANLIRVENRWQYNVTYRINTQIN